MLYVGKNKLNNFVKLLLHVSLKIVYVIVMCFNMRLFSVRFLGQKSHILKNTSRLDLFVVKLSTNESHILKAHTLAYDCSRIVLYSNVTIKVNE